MQNTQHHELSKEFLVTLDQEALINLVIQLDSKYQQLAENARIALADKYGRKTEHFISPGQLLLFPSPSTNSGSLDSQDSAQKLGVKTNQQGHTRNQKPDLPHVQLFPPPPNPALLPCPCCGVARVPTRRILQASRYQIVPARFYFEDLYSQVYSCKNCQCAEELVIETPEIVENGTASAGLLAHIAVSRDCDHIPFHRQSAIYKRSGVQLSRSTLSDFYSQTARILQPLHDFSRQVLLKSHVISTDDTPVKVIDRSKSRNMKLGRIWGYLGDETHPVTLFDYTHSRGRDGPMTFLTGFNGRLQGDCFSGNLAICAAIDTVLVACNAHARRYFIKSLPNNKLGAGNALSAFQQLYEIERTAKELGLSPENTQLMREQEAVPILKEFHRWLQQEQLAAQPKSAYGKAVFYCLNNWTSLTEYVRDGRLSIDNNHCEREMKYIAMGRKAWLFFGSDEGGKNHAIILSMIATCRRHGVEPWAYLTDVIQRLSENPNENLEDLLPYNWNPRYLTGSPAEITQFQPTPKVA